MTFYFHINQSSYEKGFTLEGKKLTPWGVHSFTLIDPYSEGRPLRKHAYSNIQKISPPKTENFQVKN